MTKAPLYCSFCGKTNFEVVRMIAGPMVFICNECVQLCVDILNEGFDLGTAPDGQLELVADGDDSG